MARAKKNVKEEPVVKEPKEEVVNVRLTTSQKNELSVAAASEGLGLSTWLLQAGLVKARARRTGSETQ
jgi:uncharacterized protein (DUF1778 family)